MNIQDLITVGTIKPEMSDRQIDLIVKGLAMRGGYDAQEAVCFGLQAVYDMQGVRENWDGSDPADLAQEWAADEGQRKGLTQ